MSTLDGMRSKSKLGVDKLNKSRTTMSRLRLRKSSHGFGSISGVGGVKTSQIALEFRRPPLIYLPTYRIDPENPFNHEKVEMAINNVLDDVWEGHRYNANGSPAVALKLSFDIMKAVKSLRFDRYRVIAVVTVGQRRSQCYNNAIAVLWDHERDGYADIVRETLNCFVQATVFGIYLD